MSFVLGASCLGSFQSVYELGTALWFPVSGWEPLLETLAPGELSTPGVRVPRRNLAPDLKRAEPEPESLDGIPSGTLGMRRQADLKWGGTAAAYD